MLLTFVVLTPRDKNYQFTFNSNTLESGLELLKYLISADYILLSAKLVDSDGTEKLLPVKKHPNKSTTDYLSRLEKEWDLILKDFFSNRKRIDGSISFLV